MTQRSRLHGFALLSVLALLLMSARVTADEVAEQSPAYREAIAQALSEYDLAHYEEARTLFAKAHAIAPSARTWRGLGMAEFELRNYLVCIEDLEQALRAPVRPLSSELRAKTEAVLARAREFVIRVELSLHPNSGSLSIDGAPTQPRADGSVLLQVGEHVLELSAPGYASERRRLSLVAGTTERVQIMLARESEVAHADGAISAQAGPPADAPKRPVYKSPWLWLGVGVAVAGAVALGVGLSMRDDADVEPIQGSPEVGGGLVQTLRFGR